MSEHERTALLTIPVPRAGTRRRVWPVLFLLFCALGWPTLLRAEMDGEQLLQFIAEARAVDEEKPEANRLRAGLAEGYIGAVFDLLREQRELCFSACRCELKDTVEDWLRRHPERRAEPAAPLLAEILRQRYPCPQRR